MLLLLSSLSVSLAATLVVDPGDSGAYATIGDAVAAASSGDTLALSADTFAECVDLDGKDLSLIGSGVDATVLDGEGCETLVAATAGESLTIEGMTLSGADGRCVAAESGVVELVDVALTDCGLVDGLHGPAVHVIDGDLALRDAVVEGSEPGWEGPLDWPGAVQVEDSTGTAVVELEDCTLSTLDRHGLRVDGADTVVVRRCALPGDESTSAMIVSAVDITLEDTEITDHDWTGGFEDEGGIVTLLSDGGTVRIEGTTIDGIRSSHKSSGGGSVRVEGARDLIVRDSAFTHNHATVWSSYSGAAGAGLAVYDVDGVWILDSVFEDNNGATRGGGAYVYGGEQVVVAGAEFIDNDNGIGSSSSSSIAGALYVAQVGGTVLIHDSLICQNSARENSSAVFITYDADDVFLTHDVIADNHSADEAVQLDSPTTLLHSVVLGNEVVDGALENSHIIDVENSVLAWTIDGAALALGSYGLAEDDLSWNAWWANDGGAVEDDDLDSADFDGTVEEDPGFTWYEVGGDCRDADFALAVGSPLIGAGAGGVDIGLCAGRTDADGDCFVAAIDPDDADPDVIPGTSTRAWPLEGTPCTPVAAEDDADCPWDGTGGPDDGGGDTGSGDTGGSDSGGGDSGGVDSGGSDAGGGDSGGADGGGGDSGSTDDGGVDSGGADSGSTGDDGATDSGSIGDDGATDSGSTGDDGTGDDGTGSDDGGGADSGTKAGCSAAPAAAWLGWLILALPLRRRR